MQGGIEWLVDAFGCSPERLRDRKSVIALLDRIVLVMDLNVIGTVVHEFEVEGGITAMYLLAESHLAIHTFPESSTITLNTYCCSPRKPAPWRELCAEVLGATDVTVTELVRGSPK
jgi:S-adenosylmethionine decarboxylase